jgi:hypothetical protein
MKAPIPFTPRGVYVPRPSRIEIIRDAVRDLIAAAAEAVMLAVFVAGVAVIALAVDVARSGVSP